ncbi:hypothetical protein [Halosimplex pelagicum]|uniref:Right-handed parallel beta-helix repeat-containing protein n=1 Tax=Halosimplex pelagicum TaxID=869886 RepID=A0A7D5PEU5_9EURY|nr:hypothetical protein [Halosimplex pelagicum]QLH82019.1 hypothetical protein HZS54_10475 [Halosimplex pelagicum]
MAGTVGALASVGAVSATERAAAADYTVSPSDSIQSAIDQAQAGDTIYVEPGTYEENLETVRSGDPGAPIEITGPADAVYVGGGDARSFEIMHSHIHVTGLTLDGLHDPDNPGALSSYRDKMIYAEPNSSTYLEDLVISPHGAGNTFGECIRLSMTRDSEVGDFEVIGATGREHYGPGSVDGSNGEVVYLGTSPSQIDESPHNGNVDETRNIYVHHIDNSAGHAHSELVNTKEGTRNILVEYCTDRNAVYPEGGEMNIQGQETVVRYCDLQDGDGAAVRLGWSTSDEDAPDAGTMNSVYYNTLRNNDGAAIKLPKSNAGASEQDHLCGNDWNGSTDDTPGSSCASDLPTSSEWGADGGDDDGGGGSGGETLIEAESADGQSGFSPFTTGSDSDASGGEYIYVPENNGSSTGSVPSNGRAEYTFSVDESTDYSIWARIRAPDNSSDSMYVSIDGGSFTTWHWDVDTYGDGSWNWDDVFDGSTQSLSSGSHTIEVAYREDGAELDRLYVTSDTGSQP